MVKELESNAVTKAVITGTMRSGTTLLADLLGRANRDSSIFCFNEGVPLLGYMRGCVVKGDIRLSLDDRSKLESFGWLGAEDALGFWHNVFDFLGDKVPGNIEILGVKYTNLWDLLSLLNPGDLSELNVVITHRSPFDIYTSNKARVLERGTDAWMSILIDIYRCWCFAEEYPCTLISYEDVVKDKAGAVESILHCLGNDSSGYNFDSIKENISQNTSFGNSWKVKRIVEDQAVKTSFAERKSLISDDELALVGVVSELVWGGKYAFLNGASCRLDRVEKYSRIIRRIEKKKFRSAVLADAILEFLNHRAFIS